ncbi:hypothetical protein H072_2932 [Dactylellina haptotyla CBS 200.50]|uniref:Ricin B lectin domain-containing protein n=1 Tax=Dactylellina haptotyla (strain CBS 200.50) TaxID=1284197 RepID=S8AJG1_DACHA|nr:hypothetical protein H072_2932 [Dactylellina haptotyla CBS 200.50]
MKISQIAGVYLLATYVYADLSKIVRVDVGSQQFIDEEGRSRHFHGTNMVKKRYPFHKDINTFIPGSSVVDQDIEYLKDLNINVVRLGLQWSGVEPIRGQYNQTYLDITATIIKKFQDNGIYTLVDQHQDVWAAQICGHGAPLWFVQPDWVAPERRMPVPQKLKPFPVDSNGIPSEADCKTIDWATSYLDIAVANAFGRLYNNHDNLGDAWAKYWKVVAENYHAFPGVMGYDLMNEPWVGDHHANPLLLVPGVADHENMEPLWNKGNAAIRSIDNTTIVMFEGSTYDILAGFKDVPGGDGSKTAQSYHYYKPPQLGSLEDTIKNRIRDAKRLKTTGMLTEFMFWERDEQGVANTLTALRQADKYLQSWAAWAYEELFDATAGTDHWGPGPSQSGTIKSGTMGLYPPLALIHARTYAEATAGITKSSYFEDVTGKYWVSWIANTPIKAPSLIRIAPKSYYPDGIRIVSNPPNIFTFTLENENVVQLSWADGAGRYNGQNVVASLQPFYPTGTITNKASGNKCIDVSKAAVSPGTSVILFTCGPRWNQVWKFKNGYIQIAFDQDHASGKFCLDTQAVPRETYLSVVLNPCQNGKASQQWSAQNGNIINTASGYCIDINASNYRDGTILLAYPCGNRQQNQLWVLPGGVDGVWETDKSG